MTSTPPEKMPTSPLSKTTVPSTQLPEYWYGMISRLLSVVAETGGAPARSAPPQAICQPYRLALKWTGWITLGMSQPTFVTHAEAEPAACPTVAWPTVSGRASNAAHTPIPARRRRRFHGTLLPSLPDPVVIELSCRFVPPLWCG